MTHVLELRKTSEKIAVIEIPENNLKIFDTNRRVDLENITLKTKMKFPARTLELNGDTEEGSSEFEDRSRQSLQS